MRVCLSVSSGAHDLPDGNLRAPTEGRRYERRRSEIPSFDGDNVSEEAVLVWGARPLRAARVPRIERALIAGR